MNNIYDMIIIGGGPGGYTAALYAQRAGLKVAVLERLAPGGQMAQTHQIDNYPGYPEGVDGFELSMRFQQQAARFGAETIYAEVTDLDLQADPKVVHTGQGDYFGRTVAISTGANPRYLGIPREQELTGRGVAYCAACDGMFYKGKTVVVVGGGNSAVADALLLSRIAKEVILVHRRSTLRATKIYDEALRQAENITIRWNSAVTELLGEGKVAGVVLTDLVSGKKTDIECQGVFISIGRKPATELVAGKLELDEGGYILADETTRTSVPGVFAVGDVRRKVLRQVVTAVSDGAVAAHMAEEFLAK